MNSHIRTLLLGTLLSLPAGLAAGTALAASDAPPPPPAGHDAGPPGPPSAERMTERMQKDLDLSDAQAREVQAINQQFVDGLGSLREQHHARLKRVLSSEQYESLLQHEQQMHQRRDRRHEQRSPPPAG